MPRDGLTRLETFNKGEAVVVDVSMDTVISLIMF